MTKVMHEIPFPLRKQMARMTMPPSDFGKVAVIFGGRSAEREVSLKSGQCVLDALQRQGVDAHPIDPDHRFATVMQAGDFDRAFIVLHGPEGEDGVIQGCLQMLGIPYTGSNVASCALAMDKVRAKLVLDGLGIATPTFGLAYDLAHATEIAEKIGSTVAVKPVYEGSSIGISRVDTLAELPKAYEMAKQYGDVMVEEWITGRDISVSVVGDFAFPPLEVRAHSRFFDFSAKYESKQTEFLCPAPLSDEQTQAICTLGYAAFCALGCEDWGRIDLVMDKNDKPWVLEVNTIPGMTPMSQLPRSARAGGWEFEILVYQILALTLGKHSIVTPAQKSQSA